MKKILTSVAMALLLVGCSSQYDDSGILTRLSALESRVDALESSVDALRSAIGEGKFVLKVEEYKDPDTQKTVGLTVTYSDGEKKSFRIEPKDDVGAPVISIIADGSGELCWAVDGVLIQVGGENVPVYYTPVFTLDEDGFLWVEVNGEKVKLGQVQNEGATLQDGIFTDLAVEQDKVVLTLSDGTKVNIPFAEAFKLNIETTEYSFNTLAPITIPYTVSAKTAGTVVGVAGYNPNEFAVEVTDENIVVTPLSMKSAAYLLAFADSKVGLTSIVNIAVEAEGATIIDAPFDDEYDYMLVGEDNTELTVKVVSNIEIEAEAQNDWIHIVDVKGTVHDLVLSLDENHTGAIRKGTVKVFKKGDTDKKAVETITIGQDVTPKKAIDLSKDGTANCYVVEEAGMYKFATVKGNTEESVGTVAKVELLWETWNNQEDVVLNSVIAEVSYSDGYISFSTPDVLHAGNALIAAKDANDEILWSWHIWVPATPITDVEEANYSAKKTMSRNLGALVDTPADGGSVESFGLLYEWGRKDPFPGLGVLSGAGAATVAGTDITFQDVSMTIAESIKNPTVYVNVASKAWTPEETATTDDGVLWGETVKTVYDPCPAGYMLPQRAGIPFWKGDEMASNTEIFSHDAEKAVFTLGSLIFPLAGYIDDGGEGHKKAGIRTIIWSGRWDSGTHGGYGVYGHEDETPSFKRTSIKRSRGGSVRCVAE